LDRGKLLLVGAGGHCHSVLDSIDRSVYTDIAIVDIPDKIGQLIYDIPIVGSDADIKQLYLQGYRQGFITLGSVGSPQKRIGICNSMKVMGFSFPVIIDPTAIVSFNGTVIEEGVFIGKGAIVNTGVELGMCSIINSGAVIDHDTKIGEFVHVSPGVSLSGSVIIGDYSHVGTGSSVIHRIEIGKNTTIGAGSVVVRNIPENVIAFGNPCKIRQEREK